MSKPKTKAKPLSVASGILAPRPWSTRADVARFLAGDFRALLAAVEDMAQAGIAPPGMLAESLCVLAGEAAAFLRDGRPREFEGQAGPGNVAGLLAAIGALRAKCGPGGGFRNAEGLLYGLGDRTLDALGRALVDASQAVARELAESEAA